MANELLILHRRIDLDASPILYWTDLTPELFERDWEVRNAEWTCRDGSLWGKNPLPAPGVTICKKPFPGNVLVEFRARTVSPSTHDIDVMWNLSWNEQTNTRGPAYVAGIQGWWEGKVGIEKSPAYKLNAAAPCPWFEPGREYFVQAGSVDGHCFLFVDGQLRLELTDTDPIDSQVNNRIGFEAYQSMVQIRQIVVRQITWTPRHLSYSPEF